MKVLISIALAFLLNSCSEDKKSSFEHQTLKETELNKSVSESAIKEDINDEKYQTEVSPKTGESIYKACAGCHGQNAQKAALGKSQIIKGWSVKQTTDALNGYKSGTYGGDLKGVMKGQASGLSDNDIRLVAVYISKL